jgi:hypothetical protein
MPERRTRRPSCARSTPARWRLTGAVPRNRLLLAGIRLAKP